MQGLLWSSVLLITGAFMWLCSDIVRHGFRQLSWDFLTQLPRDTGRSGGIGPILVSTGLIIGVCLGVSIPLGVGTAVFLNEFSAPQRWLSQFLGISLDILAGVPSIVFGLFGNAFFCKTLGLGFSILSGGLTLACMVLPILIRSTQAGLQSVPNDYRLSAAALGVSRSAVLWQVLLPAAMPGLVVGLLLGIGRAIAETAALLFTSGYVDRMPTSLMDSGRALSVHIYDLAVNVAGGEQNAYGTALVLVLLLMMINGSVSWLGKRFQQTRILDV
ncbi:MAG: phosphate ABC transporter permease PstA [Synechococcales cyanobacterium RU_4_20]|nr:phosphate ABC transporter permease PstA [Synechococcales cyanobacterium RU_4_20]NJR70863.1 phosphate ABC transporter permease PstA [Synechococcales cyanobacterium CRU_2_2]